MSIKTYFPILLAFLAPNLLADSGKPNVIIILADDQGYGDLSCTGNPILETPALDNLHNESIRFNDFHVAALCTPTRGELMTGIDAMHSNCSAVTKARHIPKRDLIMMPQIFKDNGYATGLFGKWHLGDNYPDRPMDKGFDKCVWIKGWGLRSESEYDNDYYATRYRDGIADKVETDMYCSDLWFLQAKNWMEAKQDAGESFFTYIALNAPHGPFDAPTEDYNYYKDKVTDEKLASFFGMIRNIDTNMASFEQWMVSRGLKDNTILIYMGDNGTPIGETVYNAGLRGKKGDHYEGGHRNVCFIRWPDGNLILPQTISTPTQVQDILPSLIDLAQLDNKTNAQFDGISLAPLLKGDVNDLEDRMFVVQYSKDNSDEDYKYSGSIIWDKWRLVLGNELYDLKNDLAQTTNVASQNPDVLNAMKAFYEDWWADVPRGNDQIVPLLVDLDNENPVMLNSAEWENNAVNAQWNIAAATGGSKGGELPLYIEKAGSYQIELSRWPFEFNQSLTTKGISQAIGGTPINQGVALPIEYGAIQLGTGAVVTNRKSNPNSTKISFNLNLNKGATTLQAWFKDAEQNDLCGAYYIRIGEVQDINWGENIIGNGNMEYGNEWVGIDKGTDMSLSYVSNEGVDNSCCLKLSTTSMNGNNLYALKREVDISLEQGDIVNINFTAKSSLSGVEIKPWIQDQTSLEWMPIGDKSSLSQEWKTYSYTSEIITPTSDKYQLKFWGYDIGVVLLDNVELFIQNESTGIFEEQKKSIHIYPNPVEEYLFLDKKCDYEIYNLLGKEVLYGSEQNIDVRKLNSGIYIISLENMMTKKFIKN
jgi:arylsulfatase A-like enzyme